MTRLHSLQCSTGDSIWLRLLRLRPTTTSTRSAKTCPTSSTTSRPLIRLSCPTLAVTLRPTPTSSGSRIRSPLLTPPMPPSKAQRLVTWTSLLPFVRPTTPRSARLSCLFRARLMPRTTRVCVPSWLTKPRRRPKSLSATWKPFLRRTRLALLATTRRLVRPLVFRLG